MARVIIIIIACIKTWLYGENNKNRVMSSSVYNTRKGEISVYNIT